MTAQLHSESANIVLLGDLNPSILHPSWFSSNELVRKQEADAAEIEIIHRDIAIFRMEWVEIQVSRERFQASTTQTAYYRALRDLVVGTFRLLDQTPLRFMGINRNLHYRFPSEDSWHELGDTLAPKKDWKDIIDKPGLLSLVMQSVRSNEPKGFTRVKIEPSVRVRPGIFININDHYEAKGSGSTADKTKEIIAVLADCFDSSLENSMRIAQQLSSLGGTS